MIKKIFAAILFAAALPALAQNINLIVTAGAGSAPDIVGRMVAPAIEKEFGRPVTVINRVGAGGMIGTREAAAAPADGNTLVITNATTMGASMAIYKEVGYHPLKSFDHVSIVAATPRVFAVRADFPANNLQEFLAYAKKNPGKLNIAGAGMTLEYLYSSFLAKAKDVKYSYIAYKTQPDIIPDFLGGRVDVAIVQASQLVNYAKEGKVKFIAMSWPGSLEQLPGVKNWQDQGVAELNISGWYGLAAPKGTPKAVLAKLDNALQTALKDPEVAAKLGNKFTFVLNKRLGEADAMVKFSMESAEKMAQNVGLEKK